MKTGICESCEMFNYCNHDVGIDGLVDVLKPDIAANNFALVFSAQSKKSTK